MVHEEVHENSMNKCLNKDELLNALFYALNVSLSGYGLQLFRPVVAVIPEIGPDPLIHKFHFILHVNIQMH